MYVHVCSHGKVWSYNGINAYNRNQWSKLNYTYILSG